MGWVRTTMEYMGFTEPTQGGALDLVLAEGPQTIAVLTGDAEQARSLGPVIAADFGVNLISDSVNRDEAMSIPAFSRGRDVICNTIGSLPLTCTRGRDVVERPFLRQLGALPTTNVQLIADTLEDLLLWKRSWWRVTSRDGQGFPNQVERIARDRVLQDPGSGKVKIDGKLVPDRDLIRFDSASGGLLLGKNARTLRTAILLEDAVRRYARLDVPLGFLKDSEGNMTREEIKEFLDDWEAARKTRTTSYLPAGMDYVSAVLDAQKIQLGDARNYAAADIARKLNLPASYVNAPSADSLTYATTESNRRELTDLTLRPFMAVIEQRLSMGDVTPRGLSVSFSTTRFLLGDTATVIAAGAAAIAAGIMDADEVRTEWLGLSPRQIATQEAAS